MSSTLTINTSQNVDIRYEIASVGDRIVSEIIDNLIKAGYLFLVIYLLYSVRGTDSSPLIFAALLPVMFYSLLFEMAMQGQTPGKRIRKIKVVKVDGTEATFGAYLIRWLFRIIDVMLFYGMVAIVTIVANKKGQRLGDILAQTAVIKVKDRVSLQDTIYQKVDDNYSAVFDEVKRLEPLDIELIKKALNSLEYNQNLELMLTLSQNIQKKMGTDTRGLSYVQFLRTVVSDYNYLVE
jgi:uncharacterized RDD family membrane protein YckC